MLHQFYTIALLLPPVLPPAPFASNESIFIKYDSENIGGSKTTSKPLRLESIIPPTPPCGWRPPAKWSKAIEDDDLRPAPRTKFSSVVYNGKLFIFGGGFHKTFHSDLYSYDLTTRKWECLDQDTGVHPEGPTKRRSHKAILWKKYMVLFGGRTQGGRMNDLYLYDLEKGTWERRGKGSADPENPDQVDPSSVPPERAAHSACEWGDKMVIFGGDRGDGIFQYLQDLWFYNCDTDVWSQKTCTGAVPTGRLGHACCVRGDSMYLFGGYNGITLNDMFTCSLTTGQWSTIEYNLPVRPSSFLAMVENRNQTSDDIDSLLLWGGAHTSASTYGNILYRFNCDSEEFDIISTIGEKPNQRLGHSMILDKGKMFLFGGCNENYFNDTHVLDMGTDSLKGFMRHFLKTKNIKYK